MTIPSEMPQLKLPLQITLFPLLLYLFEILCINFAIYIHEIKCFKLVFCTSIQIQSKEPFQPKCDKISIVFFNQSHQGFLVMFSAAYSAVYLHKCNTC